MDRLKKLTRLLRVYKSYRTGKTILPYPPLRLWIESTNECNLRCIFCPNATDDRSVRGYMSMTLYRSLISQLKGRVNDLNLSHRGEPLFHPELEVMVKMARDAGIHSRIHTNATKLNPERAETLLDAGPDLVSFSFDGYDKQTYESVRCGGVFEETLGNIEFFLKRRQEKNLKQPYTIIQVIEPENTSDEYRRKLHEFGDRFRRRGLDKFYIKKSHNWAGNAPGSTKLNQGYIPCTFLYYSLTILWDGTVCPCPQDWYASIPLGNVNEQSIDEIWNGEKMVDLRQRIQNRDTDGLLCENCDRVFRANFCGIPTENAKAFLAETLAGYSWVRNLIKK